MYVCMCVCVCLFVCLCACVCLSVCGYDFPKLTLRFAEMYFLGNNLLDILETSTESFPVYCIYKRKYIKVSTFPVITLLVNSYKR